MVSPKEGGTVWPRTAAGEAYTVCPEFTGDLEDPDYNNGHYSLRWEDCIFEK